MWPTSIAVWKVRRPPQFGHASPARGCRMSANRDRKSTRLNSSHANISYAVFCLKKKKNKYSLLYKLITSLLINITVAINQIINIPNVLPIPSTQYSQYNYISFNNSEFKHYNITG